MNYWATGTSSLIAWKWTAKICATWHRWTSKKSNPKTTPLQPNCPHRSSETGSPLKRIGQQFLLAEQVMWKLFYQHRRKRLNIIATQLRLNMLLQHGQIFDVGWFLHFASIQLQPFVAVACQTSSTTHPGNIRFLCKIRFCFGHLYFCFPVRFPVTVSVYGFTFRRAAFDIPGFPPSIFSFIDIFSFFDIRNSSFCYLSTAILTRNNEHPASWQEFWRR